MKRVKELQSFFSAKLHLLLVNTSYNLRRTADEMKLMEEFANHNKITSYTLNIRNDFYEHKGIINFAHEIKADMIAMATHGRRGLAHLVAGSVTEDVVNHVDCPIWTYAVKKIKSEVLLTGVTVNHVFVTLSSTVINNNFCSLALVDTLLCHSCNKHNSLRAMRPILFISLVFAI